MKKNTYPLSVKAVCIGLFFSGFCPNLIFAQKACDTLVTKDGRVLVVEILGSNTEEIRFTKCGDTTGKQYVLERSKLFENPDSQPLPLEALVENKIYPAPARAPLREETKLGRPKTMIGVGYLPFIVKTEAFDYTVSTYQVGAEIGFKHSLLRLGMSFRPVRYSSKYEDNYKRKGQNGEIGIVIKKFTKGRLTGHVGKAYWGGELCLGREAFQTGLNQDLHETEDRWVSIMFAEGFQFHFGWIALDFEFPIGIQWVWSEYDGGGLNSRPETERGLVAQPCVSIGFRF